MDYYLNKADVTFTYHEYKKSGSIDYDIDFSMEMYQQLREYYYGNHELQMYKLDKPAQNFEIQANSSDGVYNSHISVTIIDDNVVLGSISVPYVASDGYFLTDEEAEYIKEHIKK